MEMKGSKARCKEGSTGEVKGRRTRTAVGRSNKKGGVEGGGGTDMEQGSG